MGRFQEPNNPRRIGVGTFGEVFECLDTSTGRLVACKKVLLEADQNTGNLSDKAVQSILDEIAMMKKLSHPNIVQYVGAAKVKRKLPDPVGRSPPQELRIYMEYVAGGSLASMQSKYGALSESIVARYAVDILAGLSYLHEHRIAHRDIKCENLLLCSSGVIKLADFGTSKQLADEDGSNALAYTVAGTSLYMAPEVAKRLGPYDALAADIWTVGITILQLVTGKPPFQQFRKSPLQYLMHIASDGVLPPVPPTAGAASSHASFSPLNIGGVGSPLLTSPSSSSTDVGQISPELADFLSHCLVREPSERWTVQQLSDHPFVLLCAAHDDKNGAIPVFSPKRGDH